MGILKQNDNVGGYTVQSQIKQNEYTETYKVLGDNGEPYFMKVYVLKRMPSRLLDEGTREVAEIALLRKIKHQNIVSYIADAIFQSKVGECHCVVTNYFTGDVLGDLIARKGKLPIEEALTVFRGVLQGLKHLHEHGFCHNDLTPNNIMLSQSMNGTPEIIDLGHVSKPSMGKIPFDTNDLDVDYCANSCASAIFNEESDLFSAVVTFYTMLTGNAPWHLDFSSTSTFAMKINKMKIHRKTHQLDIDTLPFDERVKYVLRKGLMATGNDRYHSVEEIENDLEGRNSSSSRPSSSTRGNSNEKSGQSEEESIDVEVKRGTGNGFADIAGMDDLKAMLEQKVIFVLKEKELAERYRLTPPNGMLLYGPPGCGKTFFAEKFAEQTGFNFILVKSSDLASIYIHGSQEKISELFKKAEQNAPTVLCFDEFDALVPNRSQIENTSMSGEVNEFLSQLNNCSHRGIFVIATSNRPDRIDPAVLRTGRIDKQVYVPLPDFNARKEMFKLHMKGRPYNENEIDFDKLSTETDGYIASDIAYIVNDSAMVAAFTRKDITQELLEQSIHNTSPSIRQEVLKMYDDLKNKMEGIEKSNMMPRIGYVK